MKYLLYLYILLLILLTLSACISINPSFDSDLTTNMPTTLTATRTLTESLPPTSTSTETQRPTRTANTSTPSDTPYPTSTMAPVATLVPKQVAEIIAELLREPVDCAAPCFWGIVPGQTTLSEAENIFARVGLQLVGPTEIYPHDFYGISYEFENGLSIIATLTVQNDVVQNLRVDISPEEYEPEAPREWLAYSPETLIKRYGLPSRVDFALDWGPRSFFEMDVYFDSVDLIVEYTGHDIIPRQKGSPQVCPLTDHYEFVRIWMGKDPFYPPRTAVSLEEATGMTLEEFSKLMTGDPQNACFVVRGEVFP